MSYQPPQNPTQQFGTPPAPVRPAPRWARKRIAIPAAVILFGVGGAIGAGGESETAASVSPAPAATKTVTATPAAPVADKPKPAPTVTVTKTAKAKPVGGAPDGDDGAVKVPNFVGSGLQAAQDAAQAEGFFLLTSHDSSGAERIQAFDRNWKVCSQSPAAGRSVPTETKLDFGAVKLEEACP